MKKIMMIVVLLIGVMTAKAQEKINYDFDITRPLRYFSAQEDLKDLVRCRKGAQWSLEVKDFGTAGDIVTLKAYRADGTTMVSRIWQDATVLYIRQDNGNDSYAVIHGGFRYAILMETTEDDGTKTWFLLYSTRRDKE